MSTTDVKKTKESLASSGRGGAGNIVPQSKTAPPPENLETPEIKSPKYTTGRGGSGNIKNFDFTDPDEARRSQDVKAPVRRLSENKSTHIGRGGAANVVNFTDEERAKAKEANARMEAEAKRDGGSGGSSVSEKVKGLAEKGKELFSGKKE